MISLIYCMFLFISVMISIFSYDDRALSVRGSTLAQHLEILVLIPASNLGGILTDK